MRSAISSSLLNLKNVVKKYEPQALKLRTEAEATMERAKKEAEQRKQIRPTEARIKREEEYGRQIRPGAGGRFDDWYYGNRQKPQGFGGGERFGGKGGFETAEGGKGGAKGGAAGGKAAKGEEKEGKEEKKEEKQTRFAASPESKKVGKKIEDILDIFDQIDALLDTRFAGRPLPTELRAPTDAQFELLKATVADLGSALIRVRKLKFEADAMIKKLDAAIRGNYETTLRTAIEQRRAKMMELCQAARAVPAARREQFTGNCPGNCLDYLMEAIDGLYGNCAAVKAKEEKEAAAKKKGPQLLNKPKGKLRQPERHKLNELKASQRCLVLMSYYKIQTCPMNYASR